MRGKSEGLGAQKDKVIKLQTEAQAPQKGASRMKHRADPMPTTAARHPENRDAESEREQAGEKRCDGRVIGCFGG